MGGFTLTKRSFHFQQCKSVALFLRECIELIPPSAIFSLARHAISFLMNLQTTVVGSQLTDTFSAFSLCFFAAASSNCDASLSASSEESGAGSNPALCCGPLLLMSNISCHYFFLAETQQRAGHWSLCRCSAYPPALPLREQTRKHLQGEAARGTGVEKTSLLFHN
jgi:hypothetical protein